MNKILDDKATGAKVYTRDWRKAMSDNVAYALIVYTALNIFATVGAMRETGLRSLSLLALVVLVIGIIPACRSFERRWRNLTDEQAADLAFAPAFRRDRLVLWLLALRADCVVQVDCHDGLTIGPLPLAPSGIRSAG